jgi:hypothetical protein
MYFYGLSIIAIIQVTFLCEYKNKEFCAVMQGMAYFFLPLAHHLLRWLQLAVFIYSFALLLRS